jgi:hypothetical protein
MLFFKLGNLACGLLLDLDFLVVPQVFKTITLEHRNFNKNCRSCFKLVNVETFLKSERIENEIVGNEWGSANMNCP